MPQAVTETIKAWAAPALLTVVLALSAILWNSQQDRIASLERQISTTASTIASISANQQSSVTDRQDFQKRQEATDNVTATRLTKIEDILEQVGNAVIRLTTLQEERDRRTTDVP